MPNQHPSFPLEIARRLRELADDMESIAIDLWRCEELAPEAQDRSEELDGEAKIIRQWAASVQSRVAAARQDG